jgi:hypothetical protein
VEQEVVEQIGLYVKVQPFVMTANYPSILAFQPVWRGSATGWAAVDGLHSPSATTKRLGSCRASDECSKEDLQGNRKVTSDPGKRKLY